MPPGAMKGEKGSWADEPGPLTCSKPGFCTRFSAEGAQLGGGLGVGVALEDAGAVVVGAVVVGVASGVRVGVGLVG